MWCFYGKLANCLPLCFRHPNWIFLSNGNAPTVYKPKRHCNFIVALLYYGVYKKPHVISLTETLKGYYLCGDPTVC